MRRLRAWASRLWGVFGGRRREQDLADELESHLQLHIDDNIRQGMTPDAARTAGITGYFRPEALNTNPLFIDALARLVRISVARERSPTRLVTSPASVLTAGAT